MDSSERGENPGEFHVREMQNLAARAVNKMVPRYMPTTVHDQPACYFVTSTELSTLSWKVQSGHMQVPGDGKADMCPSAMGER